MHPDDLGDKPQPKKRAMTVDDKVRALKLREAAKLDDKVRDLRARAILIEAEADKLRAEAVGA